MSLRGFHIVFIAVSVLLAVFIGYWGLEQSQTSYFTIGIVSIVIAILLIVYGVWFYKKLKRGRLL